jgi:hypothetical protein
MGPHGCRTTTHQGMQGFARYVRRNLFITCRWGFKAAKARPIYRPDKLQHQRKLGQRQLGAVLQLLRV